ncbi:MAG: twin-arginine translocase subunit TatB [Nitrospirae bacterium]|nr:twin-arginine translocase subunit TatB [Nitrospirota bacterium]
MLDIGFQELIIIFVVALLVIGPEKLPAFSKKLGKWVAKIRRGIDIAKSQIEDEINKDIKIPGTTAQFPHTDDQREAVISNPNVTEEKAYLGDSKLSLTGHPAELRKRILVSLLGLYEIGMLSSIIICRKEKSA